MNKKLTPEQVENCKKHIAYLRSGKLLMLFDMGFIYAKLSGGQECGCSIGHMTHSLGVYDLSYENAHKLFGATDGAVDTFLFGGIWQEVNNTPEAAAARMEAFLYDDPVVEEFAKIHDEHSKVFFAFMADGKTYCEAYDKVFGKYQEIVAQYAHPIVKEAFVEAEVVLEAVEVL